MDSSVRPLRKSPASGAGRRPRFVGDLATIAIAVCLLGAVHWLPPDASLSELKKSGRITVCIPDHFPPLVGSGPSEPGFDVELVTEISARLGLSLGLRRNQAMSQDFNPRSWRMNRAQCQMLAGGVVITRNTLSFLDVSPPYLTTGWAIVTPVPATTLEGVSTVFYGGLAGLDRIELGRYLRSSGAVLTIVDSASELEDLLLSGEVTVGVTDGLRAMQLARERDWNFAWLSEEQRRGYPIGLGFWKGDLTLKRAVVSILEDLRSEGYIDGLLSKYDLERIDLVFGET